MDVESPEEFRKHMRMYVLVFVGLLCLTGLTVWVAYWKVAVPVATGIAIVIACAMAFLLVTYFMHLRNEKPIIFYCLLLTLVLLLAVLLLPLASMLLNTGHNGG